MNPGTTIITSDSLELVDDDHLDELTDDDDDDGPSSDGSAYDGDYMNVDDDVTAQLAAAGPGSFTQRAKPTFTNHQNAFN